MYTWNKISTLYYLSLLYTTKPMQLLRQCKIKQPPNLPNTTRNNLHINNLDQIIISKCAILLKEIFIFSIHERTAQFNSTPMSFGSQISSLRQRGHTHMLFY